MDWTKLNEIPFFNITFFGGLIFMITSLIMYFFPPKKINFIYGYRTLRSMKNQKNWDFAQKYSSFTLFYLSIIMVISSLLSLLMIHQLFLSMWLGLSEVLLTVFILLWKVEKAIQQNE